MDKKTILSWSPITRPFYQLEWVIRIAQSTCIIMYFLIHSQHLYMYTHSFTFSSLSSHPT